MELIGVDVFAVVLTFIGFNLAFRPKAVRSRFGQQKARRDELAGEEDQMASVFRIAGVMLMAFGITICAFANLIAYYSRVGTL